MTGSGVLMIWMPSLAKTASNMLVNFEARSRIRNLNCATRSSRSMSRLRACWATHSLDRHASYALTAWLDGSDTQNQN